MLPELVWRIPSLGTFNLHASLLPRYRGAAPINHVIMNGEKSTGVTTFLIDEQIDTGNILLQEALAIGENETAGELHDRLMDAGAELVLETVKQLAAGQLEPRPQSHFTVEGEILPPAPKLGKADCRIKWDEQGEKVVNHIRGLSPYPGAFSVLRGPDSDTGLIVKIFKASFKQSAHTHQPGQVVLTGTRELGVAVRDGILIIEQLQQEGKKRMAASDFLRGFQLTTGPYRFS
jgi:methionyl-tRNA formyltransferase